MPASMKPRVMELVFHQLPTKTALTDLPNVKNIQGFQHCYRVRVGDYRIGLEVIGDHLIVKRVLHRKDIYKSFP